MHTTHSNTQYKNDSSTVKWAQWDKTQSRELLVCSYVCASCCAQLLHTILHRTDLIVILPYPPDKGYSFCRTQPDGWWVGVSASVIFPCTIKVQKKFFFWHQLTQVVLEKDLQDGCVCVDTPSVAQPTASKHWRALKSITSTSKKYQLDHVIFEGSNTYISYNLYANILMSALNSDVSTHLDSYHYPEKILYH